MGVVFWPWPKATLMIAGMLSYLLLYAGVKVILQFQSLATELPLPVWISELLVLHQASGWRMAGGFGSFYKRCFGIFCVGRALALRIAETFDRMNFRQPAAHISFNEL